MIRKNKYILILIALLVIKGIWGVLMILDSPIHLSPDEAQYWVWSKYLDWGYYSKPPGIAWQIALGAQIFGDTELGVRFVALLISCALSLAVYGLSRSCNVSEKGSFFAGLIMAFCPLGLMASFAATTDAGFVLFWTIAFCPLAKAISRDESPNFFHIGAFVALGALFKWTIFLYWIVVLVGLFFFPKWRKKELILGIVISLCGLIPSLIWNISHDFATFRHVGAQTVANGAMPNPWEFLLAQIALLSPLLFIFYLLAFRRAPKAVIFILSTSAAILVTYITMAFFQKMQANWAVFFFPLASVAAGWFISRSNLWLTLGIALSLLLSSFVMSIPVIQERALFGRVPYSWNLFKHSLGWEKLPLALEKAGYDPKSHFLVSDRYQMTSILSFYSFGQKRAYLLNLLNQRKNQFSYMPQLKDEQLYKDGYFVVAESEKSVKKYEEMLKDYFERVELADIVPLFYANGEPVKWALIFQVRSYNGKEPNSISTY